MAWLHRRSKLRRISADRSKPLPRKAARPLTPPGKRAGCYVFTALFIIGAVLILNFPTGEPQLRESDIARHDHRARVTFAIHDEDATRRDRELAEAKAIRVYNEDAAHIGRLRGRLYPFLRFELRRPYNLLAPETPGLWGLTEESLLTLKTGFDEKWIAPALDAVEAALTKATSAGIIDEKDQQQEVHAERLKIRVRTSAMPEGEERWVAGALEYPTGLRDFLAEELPAALWVGKSELFRQAFLDIIKHAAKPTLKLDEVATQDSVRRARLAVKDRYRTITKDSIILPAGERATAQALREIREEQSAYEKAGMQVRNREQDRKLFQRKAVATVGVTVLFLVGFALMARGAASCAPDLLLSNTRLSGVYSICLLILLCMRLSETAGISMQWTPVVLGAMVMNVMAGPAVALGVTAFLAIVGGLVTAGGIAASIPFIAASAVAVVDVQRLRRRTQAFEAGVMAGFVQGVIVWAIWAVQRLPLPDVAKGHDWPVDDSLAALASGILAGSLLTAFLPYIERVFDVATDLRLKEWIDQNQPLLRKLALEAPGTYHHSTVVSNMAEVAAEEVGANALLACAGGYLHDVGKLCRPAYFIENTNGQPSPHARLSPMLSALILTAHTKDGTELAIQYGVPTPIRRIIAEHHGTCVTEYFHNKAVKEAEGTGEKVDEGTFRYRGPKPHTPESAIVMLADSAESAARSMDYASPAAIERLVHSIVDKRLKDGQLDECGMDITDVRIVERSLVRSLTAISHPRIRYPASA